MTLSDASSPALAHPFKADWSQLRPTAGLYCLPVNAAALAVGLWLHQPAIAVAIVAAAVSVGFGAFHQLTRLRIMPMAIVTLGFAASAWVGAVVGHINLATSLAIAIVWGTVFGGLTELGQETWWIGLQCIIALFVSAAYPAQPWPATQRVMLILLGGALQAGVTMLIWRWRRVPLIAANGADVIDWNLKPTRFFGIPHPQGDIGVRYAARVAGVLAVAVLISHAWQNRLHWGNGYWIPMTTAIVLKTDFRTTFTRGIARLVGTVIGAAAVTLLMAVLRPPPAVLALLLLAALWACFTVQKVNYGLFAVFMTAYVVLLLSLLGLPESTLALRRTSATLIGGVIALASFAILPPGQAHAD